MNHKGRKILCMALVLTLSAGYPASAMQAYAAEFETIDATGEDVPVQPTLPEGFSKPLEDNNGMTLTSSSATSLISDCDTVIDVNVQWNNASVYHASVTDTSVLKSKAFTLLFDVKQSALSGDTAITDPRAAFNIGNKANAIHVLTYSGKLGYGADGSSGSSLYTYINGSFYSHISGRHFHLYRYIHSGNNRSFHAFHWQDMSDSWNPVFPADKI